MQSVFAAAFDGCEQIPIGPSHLDTFCSKAAHALLHVHNNTMSPVVAFQTISPKLTDPALFVILQAIRHARQWLLATSEENRDAFLAIASSHQGIQGTSKGPASTLTHYLLRLGWSIDKDGFFYIDGFAQVNICQNSFQEISQWAHRSWDETAYILQTDRHWPLIDRATTYLPVPSHL